MTTNGSGMNGSGNGRDKDPNKEDGEENIVRFPSLAERDRMRKEELKKQAEEEKKWREAYKAQSKAQRNAEPFFNAGKIPPFTKALIAAFLVIHAAIALFGDDGTRLWAYYHFGFVPGYFTGAMDSMPLTAWLGPVSHMFLHGGWMHLFFNGVMGLALGTFFEKQFGARRTALFFFLCGLAGAATFLALNPFSTAPMIGASGGISGLFGAVILLLYWQGVMGTPGRYGPWPLIGFWLIFMIGSGLLLGAELAWQAHIGGFVAGVFIIWLARTGKIRF